MKLVHAITRGKASSITELLDRKAKRIMRSVDQAIAYAEDKIYECKEAADEIINTFGEAAGGDDTDALQAKFNAYTDKIAESEEWERQAERFKLLKEKLNSEVEIEEEEKK